MFVLLISVSCCSGIWLIGLVLVLMHPPSPSVVTADRTVGFAACYSKWPLVCQCSANNSNKHTVMAIERYIKELLKMIWANYSFVFVCFHRNRNNIYRILPPRRALRRQIESSPWDNLVLDFFRYNRWHSGQSRGSLYQRQREWWSGWVSYLWSKPLRLLGLLCWRQL